MADDRLAELRERLVESGLLGKYDDHIEFDDNKRIVQKREREDDSQDECDESKEQEQKKSPRSEMKKETKNTS